MAEAKKKDPGEITLKRVVLSYPHLVTPQAGMTDKVTGKKGADKYNASFLIPKTDKDQLTAIKAAVKRAQLEKYGVESKIPKYKPEKLAFRDGDLEDREGYEGMIFVSSSAPVTRPPQLLDRDKSVVTGADAARRFYGGAIVDAVVRFWIQDDPEYGKRVNASVEAVRYVSKGVAFGAKPVDVNEAFDDLEDDEDEDGIPFGGPDEPIADDDDLLG